MTALSHVLGKYQGETLSELLKFVDRETGESIEFRLDAEAAEDAERSLRHFIKLAWPFVDPKPYKHNWHIDAICEHLEAVSRGDIDRLLINQPPRHMKSISCSVMWPAWDWLGSPERAWLFVSYSQALSVRDSVKCRRLIESPWYRNQWADRYALTSDQNTKIRFENNKLGFRLATSVDGVLTGDGGDIVCVDDPHNVIEAESVTKREAVLSWWDEAMQTRRNPGGAFVVICQRTHDRDLSGHILAKEMGWTHLCLPARYDPEHPFLYMGDLRREPGEPLWPEQFDADAIEELERNLGPYAAAGQLQQRPAPREGGLFKRDWFAIVDVVPGDGRSVRSWDLAASERSSTRADPDYTAAVKMTRSEDGFFYIEHGFRLRASPGKVERAILAWALEDGKGVRIRIPQDPGQAGKAQVQYLTRQLAGFTVKSERETGDKQTRAGPLAAQAEAGNVILVRGAWNRDFLDELTLFPNGAHDDYVDAACGAFRQLTSGESVTVGSWI